MSDRTDTLEKLAWPDLQKLAHANGVTATKKADILKALDAIDGPVQGLGDTSALDAALDQTPGPDPAVTPAAEDEPAPARHAPVDEQAAQLEQAANEEKRTKIPGDRVERRRPIIEVKPGAYWVDPFSGLKVRDGSPVCEQSGAHRDGDEAVIIAPSWS
jgi:hypothetical protein